MVLMIKLFSSIARQHPARKEWWDVSIKFSNMGGKYLSQDKDFNRHNLANRIPIETKSY